VVRVGDRIVDELTLTGHARRPGDLARLTELGIQTVRYPALWERHPDALAGRFEWTATDTRLATMRALGLRPSLGLLHQGTGRRGDVLDPRFPAAFASYAATVARRYPWVDSYLPINEPLTTARFAGLYGHWFPHARDDRVFARMVIALVRAYRAAARAIREVRPDATILAAEDVGETFSTPALASVAEFYRQRRWLVLDLLTGRFGPSHPLRGWLIEHAVPARVLDALADVPSDERPNLIGVHNYPTSDRFLDHRMERYPAWSHGGDAAVIYADIEAVRVLDVERDGLREAVRATWRRYGLPVAMTEVHTGGEAAQRRAWWWAAVRTADELIGKGVDVRAVTAWSAFGSWEWPSLLTQVQGHYEPGLFDTRRRPPRPTVLARDVAAAAAGRRYAPTEAGWWTRRDRLIYPPVDGDGRDVAGAGPGVVALRPPPRRVRLSRAAGTVRRSANEHATARGVRRAGTTAAGGASTTARQGE
jgi:dTDP-4-dehydrorhamnose reductase